MISTNIKARTRKALDHTAKRRFSFTYNFRTVETLNSSNDHEHHYVNKNRTQFIAFGFLAGRDLTAVSTQIWSYRAFKVINYYEKALLPLTSGD